MASAGEIHHDQHRLFGLKRNEPSIPCHLSHAAMMIPGYSGGGASHAKRLKPETEVPNLRIAFLRSHEAESWLPIPLGYNMIDRGEPYDVHGDERFGWRHPEHWELSWRYSPSRYAIRIGFYIPDKVPEDLSDTISTVNGQSVTLQRHGRCWHERILLLDLKYLHGLHIHSAFAPWICYVHISEAITGATYTQRDVTPLPRIPQFSPKAKGTPMNWNQNSCNWNKNSQKGFGKVINAIADINVVIEFIKARVNAEAQSLLDGLSPPLRQDEDWFSFSVLGLTAEALQCLEAEGWKRAWHGSKFEALYSTLVDKRLRASQNKSRGERMLTNAPGVYCFQDKCKAKACGYADFMPLCRVDDDPQNWDGTFWRIMWELRVDRKRRVKPPRQTDQWIQDADSVRLVALWICGRTSDQMRSADTVSLQAWDPQNEAYPEFTV